MNRKLNLDRSGRRKLPIAQDEQFMSNMVKSGAQVVQDFTDTNPPQRIGIGLNIDADGQQLRLAVEIDPHTVGSGILVVEKGVTGAKEKLAAWGDTGLMEQWTLERDGTTVMAGPRVGMVRSVMLNHWYHHRGQLLVYLRLLDVPVPSVYGPSADEDPFAQ
jgi:DinB family